MKETGPGGVQDRCVKHARARLWYARKTKSSGHNSMPDFVFAKCSRLRRRKAQFFVEFKATGVEAEALQLEEHRLMREAGLEVYVFDDVEAFKQFLASKEP